MFRLLFAFLLLATPVAAQDCVVLVHGLARTEASLTIMERRLAEQGYRVENVDYPSTTADIATLAAEHIPQAVAACGQDRIHFVTHSMGGILVRMYLTWDTPDRLGHVVMMGPPNRGSALVDALQTLPAFNWINGPAGAQLGTGPESVPTQLPPVTYPVGVIAGRSSISAFSALIPGQDDGKVGVEDTHVAGEADHITLPVTHTFMMINPMVVEQVIAFLRDGKFDRGLTEVQAQRRVINWLLGLD